MPMTLRVAVTLVAALALFSPVQAGENPASESIASNETKNETKPEPQAGSQGSEQGQADASVTAKDEAQAAPEDPFTTSMRAKLAAIPQGTSGRDKAERTALAEYYAARQYRPFWVTSDALSGSARAVITEIKSADDWGLAASDFALPTLAGSPGTDELADAEVKLGVAVLKYARFARGGRLDPTSLTKFLDRTPPLLEPKQILDEISTAEAPDAYLRSQHPKHAQFELLRQKYLALRQSSPVSASAVEIPKGSKLEPGARHAHIALVRKRLGVAVASDGDEETYDAPLVKAVKAFQTTRGIDRSDGTIDAATRRALSTVESGGARRVLANMEQWRWMPRQLGDYYVWVNIPDFMIRVVQNGRVIHAERIVIGKVDTQTPIFSDEMEQVIFHPFWGVPDSIKRNELQPNLAAGGSILARQGLRVQYRGRDVDPEAIDWGGMDMRNVHIYQPPGPSNVLGVVKFRFPNKHDVYFHDTPQKHLFQSSVRTFSHGCMRVQNPVRLAELILARDKSMSADRVRALASPGSPQDNQVNLTSRIPVHITYFTASVEDGGQVAYRNDIYRHEERISLGLEGKRHLIAKVPEPKSPARREYGSSYSASKSGPMPGWMRSIFNF